MSFAPIIVSPMQKLLQRLLGSGLNVVVVGVQAKACTEANQGLHSSLSTCSYRFNPPPGYCNLNQKWRY